MSYHFSKGYASGILKKYQGKAWKEIFMFLVFGILAPVIFFIFALMAEKPGIIGETETLLIGACSALALAVVSLWSLAKFIRTTSSYRTIAKMVRSLTDEKQLRLAVECYHANGDSLAVDEPWVEVLMSFMENYVGNK